MQEVFEKIMDEIKEKSYEIQLDGAIVAATKKVAEVPDIVNIVNKISEEYNNGWIPCSERLPEDEQVVLTCKCKSISILRYSTKTNHWYELSGNWWWYDNMVTAWQPLPSPYQSKGNHKKKTNFDMCRESMEAMAQIIEIAKIGWTKEQIMEWLQSEVEE